LLQNVNYITDDGTIEICLSFCNVICITYRTVLHQESMYTSDFGITSFN